MQPSCISRTSSFDETSLTAGRGGTAMQRFAFSTDDLPDSLDDRARFIHWRDLYSSLYGAADMVQSADLPFSAHMNAALFGSIAVSRIDMAVDEMSRHS